MAGKLSTSLLVAALASLALCSSAFARAGLAEQRALGAAPARAAAANPLVAPAATCPGQTDLEAAVATQVEAMRCMTNFARVASGLPALADSPQLDESAAAKGSDVVRCDSFSHFACEREFTYWIERGGYIGEGCWRAGENLAWGAGELGSVRSIFRAWLASPTHRQNILSPFADLGLSLTRGSLEGHPGAAVWAAHFGSHCEV